MSMLSEQIVRIDHPTPAQLDQCIAAHRPVIFTGLLDGEVAARSWDLPYLRAKLGHRAVQVASNDKPRLYWDPTAGLPLRQVPFDEFVARAFGGEGAGYSYLQDDVNSFPFIKDDYRLPPMMADKDIVRAKFWLSGAGLITPLHYDPVETFHWVIRGAKRFICYPPGVRSYYPFSWRSTAPFISRVDPDHPEPDRFPRFGRAAPLEFSMKDGDVLYLPAFWWHQVYSEGDVNISLNFVWFASAMKSVRYLPQFARTARHLALRIIQVRAKRKQARAELERTGAGGPPG
jgi:hypothetical protein